ncbi:MAG: lysylphosphatidylglycerol synthase transmembrane domain-containing protein [Candidatus Margulisiibacteriota bacterium]
MKKLGLLLGLLVSALLLGLLFYRLDLPRFAAACRSANYWLLIPSLAASLFVLWLRAVRWQWLVRPLKTAKLSNLFAAAAIGYFFNTIMPGRVGEFARAHYLGKTENISRAAAFATVVVERLFDGLSILVILALLPFWLRLPARTALAAASWSALALYLFISGLIALAVYRPELAARLSGRLPAAWRAKAEQTFNSLVAGFKTILDPRVLFYSALYSFLIWGVSAYSIYLAVMAFHQPVSFAAALFILVLLTFTVIIPSSPGYLGTFDVGMAWGLMFFGLARENALGVTIVYHGMGMISTILLGAYYLIKSGFDWRGELS